MQGYGIYVEDGRGGTIDHDYVSGAADAAYYVGECKPCRATIANVVATRSAVGYSGTNATGVVIRDSRLGSKRRRDRSQHVRERGAATAGADDDRAATRSRAAAARGFRSAPRWRASSGSGSPIAGGNENSVHDNRVTGSERYGVAVFPTARFVTFDPHAKHEPGPPWRPRGNRIVRNVVTGSGWTDLALAAGSASGNCFTNNTAGTTAPRRSPDRDVRRLLGDGRSRRRVCRDGTGPPDVRRDAETAQATPVYSHARTTPATEHARTG